MLFNIIRAMKISNVEVGRVQRKFEKNAIVLRMNAMAE